MKIQLKIHSDKEPGSWNCYAAVPPEALYEKEMEPEEFALMIAMELRYKPEMKGKREYVHAPIFATILGQDQKVLNTTRKVTHSPEIVTVRENICDGKLIQISIWRSDSDEHYFFRDMDNRIKYVPIAKECRIATTEDKQRAYALDSSVLPGDPMWPWLALYPEKFAGLIEFCKILEPDDENPLTGLISSKGAPVRTLAKQVASKFRRAREQWARDIVTSL